MPVTWDRWRRISMPPLVWEKMTVTSPLWTPAGSLWPLSRNSTKNQALEAENAALQTQIDDLETRLTALERAGTPQPVSTLSTWWPLAGLVVLAGMVVAQRRR